MGNSAADLISATIGQLLSALLAMSDTFAGLGLTFLSLAVILTIFSGVYAWWLSGSFQDLAANGVRTLILVAPIMILFSGWGGYMQTFGNFFYTELPSHLGITGGASPEFIVGEAIKQVQDAVKFPEQPAGEKKSFMGIELPDFSMASLLSLVLTVLVLLLNALLIFGMIFAVFMPIAGLFIGMIFGPLILAWLPWRPLGDMTGRWLGFMIANGITFVVAIVIIKALSNTLAAMSAQLIEMVNDGFMTGLAGYVVTLVALFAIYIFATNLMLQANNIAQGMTGGATVGEGLFGSIAAAGAAAGMARLGGATGNLHKIGAKAAGSAAASAPGAIGQGAVKAGMGAQAIGTAAAISGVSGSSTLASAGNALRSAGGALNTVQGGINKAGSVLSKGADKAKSTAVYKELNKPALKPFSGGGGGGKGEGDGGKGGRGGA